MRGYGQQQKHLGQSAYTSSRKKVVVAIAKTLAQGVYTGGTLDTLRTHENQNVTTIIYRAILELLAFLLKGASSWGKSTYN